MRHPSCLPAAAALAAAFTFVHAAGPVPELVSRRAAGLAPAATGNGPSHDAGFAGGGRFVFFTSGAAGLVAHDANGPRLDVFRRDLAAGVTELVSLGPDGQPWGDAEAFGQSASADGMKVAFVRQTLRPVAGSSLLENDIYVRDLTAGATTLVSVRADGQGPGNGASGYGVLSADGRFVVFESVATDLAGGADTNGATDVFLRDLAAGTTQRLSNRAGSADAGNASAHSPQVSADGGVVVFHSQATDLVEPLVGNLTDLYVWQRADGRVRRVTLPGPAGDSGVRQLTVINAVLSGDGRYLAFRPTWAGGDGLAGVWWLDLETGTQTRVAEVTGSADAQQESGSGPVLSGDGRTLAFTLAVTNDAVVGQRIHLWNADTGLHTLEELVVTLPPGGGEPPTSESPVLSADATKLAFLSLGPVPGTEVTGGGEYRLFVRTLATGHTVALPTGMDTEPYDLPNAEFSPEGGRLLFESESALGLGHDLNGTFDIFVSELVTGQLTTVSVAASGVESATPNGFSSLLDPALSADGRYVLFLSLADDVVTGDTNRQRDLFRHDRQTGETKVVSALLDGTMLGGTLLDFTSDGRFVLFTSLEAGYAAGDTNLLADAFLKDMETGTVTLVSAKDGLPPASGNGPVVAGVVSADGRHVAFESRASDLTTNVLSSTQANVFLRDVLEGRTVLISANGLADGVVTIQGRATGPVISDDGELIAFTSTATRAAWLYRRATGRLTRLSTENNVLGTGLSRNGQWASYHVAALAERVVLLHLPTGGRRYFDVAARAGLNDWRLAENGSGVFSSLHAVEGGSDTNGLRDIYFYDHPADEVRLVSRGVDGVAPLGGHSEDPQLTPDGRFIVFRSWATNLVAGDLNNTSDVFLHDTLTGQTTLLSANPQTGRPGNWMSITPAISADGRVAVFASGASDLVPGDLNGFGDIFAVALPAPPAPLVLTAVAAGQGGARLRFQWAGNPGVRYAVRVTENLNGPWETVGGELLGTGEPLSFEEPEAGTPPGGTGRYYQVIELP